MRTCPALGRPVNTRQYGNVLSLLSCRRAQLTRRCWHGTASCKCSHAGAAQADAARVAALEAELRRGRRREEKLAAMQFRLREDVAAASRDPAAFDRLRDVRGLEYELDFVTNRAQRTEQARGSLQYELRWMQCVDWSRLCASACTACVARKTSFIVHTIMRGTERARIQQLVASEERLRLSQLSLTACQAWPGV